MTAFNLHLECENCGHSWHRGVEPGMKVFPQSMTRNVVKIGEESVSGGIKSDSETQYIDCPCCETRSQVKIRNREPVKS